MKKGRIILCAVTLILAVSSALGLNQMVKNKFHAGTLFTKPDGTGPLDCIRGIGSACATVATTLYTAHGTPVNGPWKQVAY